MLKGTVVFMSLVCVALAGIRWENLQTKPRKFEGQAGCYVKNLDAVIPVGQSTPARNRCEEYSCEKYKLRVNTCDAVYADHPCFVEEGYGQYPNCCPKKTCVSRH